MGVDVTVDYWLAEEFAVRLRLHELDTEIMLAALDVSSARLDLFVAVVAGLFVAGLMVGVAMGVVI